MTLTEFTQTISILCQIHDCSVTSWIRSEARNESVGGVSGSRHMLKNGGKACDVVPDNSDLIKRNLLIVDARKLGLVCLDETDHVHIHDNP